MKHKVAEPSISQDNYVSSLSAAFNWYNQEKDKKDARVYLREYIGQHFTKGDVKAFDRLPDGKVVNTYAWITRLVCNGAQIRESDHIKLDNYLQSILDTSDRVEEEEIEVEKVARPSVRDNMKEKVNEYLGELEGALDDFITQDKDYDLYASLKGRSIPQPYVPFIIEWVKKTAAEFISVYESTDSDVKEGYSNIPKRKLTQLIKLMSQWLEDAEKYGQYKKANRKQRAKKIKSPVQQVAKIKFKKEDTELGIKSVYPSEMVGASQVWIYNTKYKKLAVYRSDSSVGIQVKGTTLQNYEPENCEQKALRKPKEVLDKVLTAGKVQLRRILDDLTTKESPVNGRINEECIILRVIK